MSPLVALLLIGFLFVIALCLTIWAALSWVTAPRRDADAGKPEYVPLTRGPQGTVWRAGTTTAFAGASSRARVTATEPEPARPPAPQAVRAPAPQATRATASVTTSAPVDASAEVAPQRLEADNVRVRQRRNDDFRGANATVTQRPNLDDAFDRFLEQERKQRH